MHEATQFAIVSTRQHAKGRIYEIEAGGRTIVLRLSFHALLRSAKWGLSLRRVLLALLFPNEVLKGHRNRFIAHRRSGDHLVRAVYEYEESMPVITMYYPSVDRYFQGGSNYEDRILS